MNEEGEQQTLDEHLIDLFAALKVIWRVADAGLALPITSKSRLPYTTFERIQLLCTGDDFVRGSHPGCGVEYETLLSTRRFG